MFEFSNDRDISNPETNSVAVSGVTDNRQGEKTHREMPKEKKKGKKKGIFDFKIKNE